MNARKNAHFSLLAAMVLAVGAADSARAASATSAARAVAPGESSAEGFARSDRVAAPERKEPSWILHVPAEDTPAAQLERARRLEARGAVTSARKAFDALVFEWGSSPEAAEAQYAVARLREREGDYEEAFREYEYYLIHYGTGRGAEGTTYADVVARQYAIANEMRAELGRSIWGPSEEVVASMYRHVVANAPDAPHADEAVFHEGWCYERDDEWVKAVTAYEKLPAKYPRSPLVPEALYRAGLCRARDSNRHPNDERSLLNALEVLRAAVRTAPSRPEAAEASERIAELSARASAMAFERAAFYDRIRHNDEASVIAYRDFLRQYPNAAESAEARERLAELEGSSASEGVAP